MIRFGINAPWQLQVITRIQEDVVARLQQTLHSSKVTQNMSDEFG